MTRDEVVKLMGSSKSEQEWNDNCDKVEQKCKGYPDFWFASIIQSGLCAQVSAKWGGDDKIHIL